MSILLRQLTSPHCSRFSTATGTLLHIHDRLCLGLNLLACGLYLQWVRAIDRSADHVVFKGSSVLLWPSGWIRIELKRVVAAIDEHATLLSNQFLALGRRRDLTECFRLPAQYVQPIQHPLLIEFHVFRCEPSSQRLNLVNPFLNIIPLEQFVSRLRRSALAVAEGNVYVCGPYAAGDELRKFLMPRVAQRCHCRCTFSLPIMRHLRDEVKLFPTR